MDNLYLGLDMVRESVARVERDVLPIGKARPREEAVGSRQTGERIRVIGRGSDFEAAIYQVCISMTTGICNSSISDVNREDLQCIGGKDG